MSRSDPVGEVGGMIAIMEACGVEIFNALYDAERDLVSHCEQVGRTFFKKAGFVTPTGNRRAS